MPGFNVEDLGDREGVSGRQEYYYNYFWEVEALFDDAQGFKKSALINLKDATLPTFTINKETYTASSLDYKFAKSVNWDDIKIAWYDTIGLLEKMKEWRQSVWTPECGIKMPNEYKKVSTLSSYLPTGDETNRWTLHNSWPSQIRYGDLTYANSEVKIIEITVTYDWAEELPA